MSRSTGPTKHGGLSSPIASIHGALIVLLLASSSFPIVLTRSHSPCADSDNKEFDLDKCLEAIKVVAEDRHKYWFGDTYKWTCGNKSEFVAECFNPYAKHEDSLVSRIFRRRFYDREKLNTFLKVTYQTYTGRYEACGHTFTMTESRNVIIDPLSYEDDLTPFQLLIRPSITWKESIPAALHTLAIYDAGYVTVKALYVNVPGSDIDMGQTVVPYEPPLNPTSNKNPYVFLLFRQPKRLELSSKWLHRLSRRDEGQFEDFLAAFNLEGPVGLSWFTVRSDPYSAEVKRSRGYMNTCARFVDEAFKSKELPFLPDNQTELSVYIDATFNARALKIESCCHRYAYPAATFKPNPLGDRQVPAAFVRSDSDCQLHFTKSTAFSDRERDFKSQYHSLVVVDLDIPSAFGSRDKPFIHWLVVNIKDGDFKTGQEILNYLGPAPPHPYFHTYYFLLFRQSHKFIPKKGDYAFGNCTSIFYGRCGFDMTSMIKDGGLELEGATWMLVKNDEYVRHFYINQGMDEKEVCSSINGYAVNCVFPEKFAKEGNFPDSAASLTPSVGLWIWLVMGKCALFWTTAFGYVH